MRLDVLHGLDPVVREVEAPQQPQAEGDAEAGEAAAGAPQLLHAADVLQHLLVQHQQRVVAAATVILWMDKENLDKIFFIIKSLGAINCSSFGIFHFHA